MTGRSAQIANYEYGFFWYLYQDGTIQHEVKLTGILSTNGMSEGDVRVCCVPLAVGPRSLLGRATVLPSSNGRCSSDLAVYKHCVHCCNILVLRNGLLPK